MENNGLRYMVAPNIRGLIKQANEAALTKEDIISIVQVKDAVYLVY